MRSCLYKGIVEHVRCHPVVHRFVYPFSVLGVDLDELPNVQDSCRWFSYNRFNLLSLYDRDYLPGKPGCIKEKLFSYLDKRVSTAAVARVELITSPRICHYVFNPVSFYRCFDVGGQLIAAIAEVRNTFGERHLYLLTEEDSDNQNSYDRFQWCKEFHVSPFNDMEGKYRFYFHRSADQLDVRVNLEREALMVMTARLSGQPYPLDAATSLKSLGNLALQTVQTTPRIMVQAAKLRFKKKLPVYTKPIASSEMTIESAPPGPLQRAAMKLGFRFLSRIKRGQLTVSFPDGAQRIFGDPSSGPSATLYVKNYDFFVRSVLFGDIGFGESFTDAQWETDDLTALLGVFLENERELDDRSIVLSYIGRAMNRVWHTFQRNSPNGSRKNIGRHYDLSNELFRTFLDSSMTYSCAQFRSPDDDLETAQQNKIDSIIQKANLQPNDHVLEIGCGWGSFAISAARDIGCKVTGVTLSKEQYDFARERVEAEGLSDLVDIQLRDYRTIQGRFDKIVSIEMLEAVGHRYLGNFFELCDRVLKPNGLVVLQVITFPDYRYHAYRFGCDWIQKYIFPGGLCPSLTAICNALSKNSRLLIEDIENIGVHYAATLAKWRTQFWNNASRVKQLGFDERFQRVWDYYFSYCEAAFSTRTLGTMQIVLTRTNNKQLPFVPQES